MSRDPVEGWFEQQAIAKLASWSWWELSLSGEPSQTCAMQTVCRSGVRVTMCQVTHYLPNYNNIYIIYVEAGAGVWSSWTRPLHIVTDHSHLGTEVLLSSFLLLRNFQLTVAVKVDGMNHTDNVIGNGLNRMSPNFIALLSTTEYGVLTSYSLLCHDPGCKWCHISSSGGFLLVMRASSSSAVSVSCPDKSWTLV